MFVVDRLLLVAAILFLTGILSNKLSYQVGLPALVLFVAVGMLAGSEGIGGIAFEDYQLAHGVGTVALAVILFDGGLRTEFRTVRPVLGPATVLATVGVLLTAVLTGLVAFYVLGLPLLPSLLFGSIVGSTDAAAVFAVLRSSGLHLPKRLSYTLEFESGANDPMAVFLTVGLIQVLLGEAALGWELVVLFIQQMAIGAVAGLAVGRATATLVNRIHLPAAGLYPVFTLSAGILAFGIAAVLGGSGFLSVYLAGVVLGSHRIVFQRGILLSHDGAAWLAQIALFVMLGLLSTPSRLADAAGPGMLIAAGSMLIARPAAVWISLLPFRYSWREHVVISVAGLKGAVPIVLGIYPLLLGIQNGEAIFDMVFFVVMTSALVQGWSIPVFARWLGLEEEAPARPIASLEITSLHDLSADIVEYTVPANSPIAGQTVRSLALPDEAVIAMIVRGDRIIAPRGSTPIRPDDHLFFVINPKVRELVEGMFVHGRAVLGSLGEGVEFPLRGSTTLEDLCDVYDIDIPGEDRSKTLDEILRERLGGKLEVGRGVALGDFKVRVREIADGRVESAAILMPETPEEG